MQDHQEKKIISTQHARDIRSLFFRRFFPVQLGSMLFFSTLFISKRFVHTLPYLFLISISFHFTSFHALAEEKTTLTGAKIVVEKSNKSEPPQNNSHVNSSQKNKNATKSNTPDKSADSDQELIEKDIKVVEQNEFGWGKYFQAIGTMLFLLLVLWYMLKLIRKYGNGRFLPAQKLLPKDAMYIEGQLSLGPNKCITIVKVLDKRLILGITEKNITLLTEMVDNEELTTKSFHEHVHDATNNPTPASNNSHDSHTLST